MSHTQRILLTALCLAQALNSVRAADEPPFAGKPIAVVGAEYGRYDVKRFQYLILAPSEVAWELKGEFLDPEEFPNYSLVILFSSCPEELTPQQMSAIRDYLEQGGRLLHTGGGIYTGVGRKLKPYPWLRTATWNYHGNSKPPQFSGSFLLKDHPYLAGVDTNRAYKWQESWYSVKLMEGALNIIGHGDRSNFCVVPVGKGQLIWLWEGIFRLRQNKADMVALYEVFRNIIRAAKPLTIPTQIEQNVPELRTDPSTLVCWRRDWELGAQNDYVFVPPYPGDEDRLKELDFYSAIGERDSQFFLCQSLTPQKVTATLTPLRQAGTDQEIPGQIRLLISAKPPVVPSLVRKGMEHLPGELGAFMLTPVDDGFEVGDHRPRVLWLELSTHGLAPGRYASRVSLKGERGGTIALPINVKVYPVRMPKNRMAKLRYWGGSMPSREPFFSELERQGCCQVVVSYPQTDRIKVRGTGLTLRDALKAKPTMFSADRFPELDFTGMYDDALLGALAHGLNFILVRDVRTGALVASAGTGQKLDWRDPSPWPEDFQALYALYYQALYEYFQERGFEDADEIWMDEPTMEAIRKRYVPRAKLHARGGMGSAATWTTPGFMRPEDTNVFARYTTGWSMYPIMFGKFLRFVRESSVEMHPRARIGITRGGCGFALRNPYNRARALGWQLIYYGEPVNFLCTGPLWKQWLYYVDFDRDGRYPQGVEGERLLAFGSSDPTDETTPLLSSSDWEGARDGVDDANIARILEWYLKALAPRSKGLPRLAGILDRIKTDKALWFGEESPIGFGLEPAQYRHKDLSYDYVKLIPPSSTGIELAKKRVLDYLEELVPFAGEVAGSLHWHQWELVSKGQVKSSVVVPADADPRLRAAVDGFLTKCRQLSGSAPALRRAQTSEVSIVVGTSADPLLRQIMDKRGWSADNTYPGAGSYLIKRDREAGILLVVGTDLDGAILGLRNFSVFLQAHGHWLSPAPR